MLDYDKEAERYDDSRGGEPRAAAEPNQTEKRANSPSDLVSSLTRPARRQFTPKRSLVRSQYRP
ncbi:hypothetical protein ACWDVV_28015, partial [Streptomyces tendae]